MTEKVEILYFTDPFCSWCWATEPPLFRLREVFRDQLQVRYVMGGLVKDMSDFYDAHNSIRATAQVAPHWRMVSDRSGQPIDERLMEDITDAHWSTWPACVAVKAADLQGSETGERYLRRLRRAALTERQDVSVREVQLSLARSVTGLDATRLEMDLDGDEAAKAFSADLRLGRECGVSGFPTLLFKHPSSASAPEGEDGILVGGLLAAGNEPTGPSFDLMSASRCKGEVHGECAPLALLAGYCNVASMLLDDPPRDRQS